VPEKERGALPDSLVLRTADGRVRVRSEAVLESLRQIGGPWVIAAALGALVPRPLADRLYDAAARLRRRLFRPPADVCLAVPAHLRARFLP
jgi:predicted DCC family thiol-disulfide oxidoreductase YuxK